MFPIEILKSIASLQSSMFEYVIYTSTHKQFVCMKSLQEPLMMASISFQNISTLVGRNSQISFQANFDGFPAPEWWLNLG